MGQHGGIGHPPVLAISFGLLLSFTLTFFIQIFEHPNSPQTILNSSSPRRPKPPWCEDLTRYAEEKVTHFTISNQYYFTVLML